MQHFYSTLFRWPCSISIQLSPRSVTGAVRPFLLAMWHFYSWSVTATAGVGHVAFLSLLVSAVTGGVRPFPLAM